MNELDEIITVLEQFQSSFREFSEQFQSSFRAVSEKVLE